MARVPDWERRLGEFVAENAGRAFEWGEWDCILFATAAAEAMTGVDEAAEFRGRYSDRAGSAAILREKGKGTLLRTVDAHFKRKPAGMAQRGDLVWFKGSVGVCMGGAGLFVGEERLAEAAGEVLREGLISVPHRCFEKAWTV